MASQITNQATLNYTSGTLLQSASSNTASILLQDSLKVAKHTLETFYQPGGEVTYSIFITNTSNLLIQNITLTDNLGSYDVTAALNVTPLTYLGPAKLYLDHVYQRTVDATVSAEGNSVSFALGNLAAGSTFLLQYKTAVNEYAGGTVGEPEETSFITNTASVTGDNISVPISATSTIYVQSYADISIEKQMSPNPVLDGGLITYTFLIRNYGTIPATKVFLSDTFRPAPDTIEISIQGTATDQHSYDKDSGAFQFPSTESPYEYTVDAAVFEQHPDTGVYTIRPGISTVVVEGHLT